MDQSQTFNFEATTITALIEFTCIPFKSRGNVSFHDICPLHLDKSYLAFIALNRKRNFLYRIKCRIISKAGFHSQSVKSKKRLLYPIYFRVFHRNYTLFDFYDLWQQTMLSRCADAGKVCDIFCVE